MNFEKMTEKEILSIANPIMDNLMDASPEIDHERHTRDFTNRMTKIVTRDHLQKVCEDLSGTKGLLWRTQTCSGLQAT
jgi:hypothetical protein